jgi:hypothetical protein
MILRRNKLGGVSPSQVMIPLDVTVYGRTKNYAPDELVGGLTQGDTEVTITNAEIAAAQWPGPPITGDQMIIDGKVRRLKANPEPEYLGSEILVYVCQVTG